MDNNLGSDQIRDVLDDEISDLEDTSDIDVPELDSEVSLEDYSSDSGEEYVPNFEDLESSEVDISHHTVNNSDSDEDDTPNPNRPIQEFSNAMWLRTYTPKLIYKISLILNQSSRTTPKYWKKLLMNFIDIALFNAFILYSNNTDRPVSRYVFLVEIVHDLVNSKDNIPQRIQPGPGDDTGHKIAHLEVACAFVLFVVQQPPIEADIGVLSVIVVFTRSVFHI
ncbi:hypothetical protein J6590_095585 [Homalodisca vitripennis]|nr:hypothetical protein J6590_065602 [Homalodisca vitripennis]KAG8324295.1 hypothetical protein J6590_095585 [Homalodisca vitripennis]